MLGYKKGERVDLKKVKVEMLMGISTDEIRRMRMNRLRYIDNQYPLINDFGMSRQDCIMWMKDNNYPAPPRSACYFCPFHSQSFWKDIQENDPELFAKAVKMDKEIRLTKTVKDFDEFYLHKSFKALDKALEDDGQLDMFEKFNSICDEGMCGV